MESGKIYKRRLAEIHENPTSMVAVCLSRLALQGAIELVPDSYQEDEQRAGCEATFRHLSGAYLLYARHMDHEQLDIAVPCRLNSQEAEKATLNSLRNDLAGLLVEEPATS